MFAPRLLSAAFLVAIFPGAGTAERIRTFAAQLSNKTFQTSLEQSVDGATVVNQDPVSDFTPEETELIAGSRSAILAAGISPEYFDDHFAVAAVHNLPSDRRVVWQFKIGEFEARVQDAIGTFSENGEVKQTHSVPMLAEISRVISRRRAERILRACIGPHSATAVEFRARNEQGLMGLFLTASATSSTNKQRKGGKTEKYEQQSGNAQSDFIDEEAKRRSPVILGAVDLETGKCRRGEGWAGPSVKPQI